VNSLGKRLEVGCFVKWLANIFIYQPILELGFVVIGRQMSSRQRHASCPP